MCFLRDIFGVLLGLFYWSYLCSWHLEERGWVPVLFWTADFPFLVPADWTKHGALIQAEPISLPIVYLRETNSQVMVVSGTTGWDKSSHIGILCIDPQAEEIKGMIQIPRRKHKRVRGDVLSESRDKKNCHPVLLLSDLNFLWDLTLLSVFGYMGWSRILACLR